MEEGRYLGAVGVRRDCGGVIRCLFGRNIRCVLVFYGLYSYLLQVVADNGQEIGSQLVEQFGKTRDGASNLQQAVAQLVLVLRGIYADCRQMLCRCQTADGGGRGGGVVVFTMGKALAVL